MPDLNALPIADLEKMCDARLLDLYRKIHRDPESYRAAILEALAPRPRLPIEELLSTICKPIGSDSAWSDVVDICRRSVPGAPWNHLPQPNINRDIAAAEQWLESQLRRLDRITGVYLGLDALNMGDGDGKNVEIGGTANCDPQQDSIKWLYSGLTYGNVHLIHGLYELHAEYSTTAWRVNDKSIPCGSFFSFADYVLFLSYSGIVLGNAFQSLKISRPFLASWGFHDGDMFLLCRNSADGFAMLCRLGDE
jgi:hypothetical protein